MVVDDVDVAAAVAGLAAAAVGRTMVQVGLVLMQAEAGMIEKSTGSNGRRQSV